MARLRTRQRILVCAAILIALFTSHVRAAPPTDPLLDILARVPDSPKSRNLIYYSNHAAIEAAYPPAKPPTSLDQLKTVSPESKDDPAQKAVELWWYVFRNTQ